MPDVGVKTIIDDLQNFTERLSKLTRQKVLVGVPEKKTERKDDGALTNAELAYIHDHGAPEANIPARPFMQPGILAAKDEITDRIADSANAILSGETGASHLAAAGQAAASSIQRVIKAGVPPPLAASTVRNRRRRSRGSKYRRIASVASETTPLIDTGQLVRSITYVVRPK